jgi:hypothetical protein
LDRNTLPYKGWFQPYSVSFNKHSFFRAKTDISIRHTSVPLG